MPPTVSGQYILPGCCTGHHLPVVWIRTSTLSSTGLGFQAPTILPREFSAMPLANELAILAVELPSKMSANADRRLRHAVYFVHVNLPPEKRNEFCSFIGDVVNLAEELFHARFSLLEKLYLKSWNPF